MLKVVNFVATIFLGSYYILSGIMKNFPQYFDGVMENSRELYGLCYENSLTKPLMLVTSLDVYIRAIGVFHIIMGAMLLLPCPCGSMVGSVGLIIHLCLTIACTDDSPLRIKYLTLFSLMICCLILKMLIDIKRIWDRRVIRTKMD